jgi:HPt (histidine-containing phosphotransfer) domain-containing protein
VDERTDPNSASPLDDAVLGQLVTDLDAETAARLVAAFVEEMLARTARMARAADAGDALAVQHEAHALKASAATYGAREVSEAAREIESLCRAGRDEPARRSVRTLPALADRAAAAFAAWRELLETR